MGILHSLLLKQPPGLQKPSSHRTIDMTVLSAQCPRPQSSPSGNPSSASPPQPGPSGNLSPIPAQPFRNLSPANRHQTREENLNPSVLTPLKAQYKTTLESLGNLRDGASKTDTITLTQSTSQFWEWASDVGGVLRPQTGLGCVNGHPAPQEALESFVTETTCKFHGRAKVRFRDG